MNLKPGYVVVRNGANGSECSGDGIDIKLKDIR